MEFSKELEGALHKALNLANDNFQEYSTVEHLLLALIYVDSDALSALRHYGVNVDAVADGLFSFVTHESQKGTFYEDKSADPTKEFQTVIQQATIAAELRGAEKVTGASVLLEIFTETESLAAGLLSEYGMSRSNIKNYVEELVLEDGFKKEQSDTVSATILGVESIKVIEEEELQPLGFDFHEIGGQFVITESGTSSDFDAADDQVTNQLHPEVLRRATSLADASAKLDNQLGWKGLADSANRLSSVLREGPLKVAERIIEVWTDIVELGTFLDQDNQIKAGSTSFVEPLAPETRRLLESLITIASPWVRRFPTAAHLDMESAAFQTGKELIEDARAIVIGAKESGLLRAEDAGLLGRVLDAAERSDNQGAKSKTTGIQSSRNIVIQTARKILPYYISAALGAAVPQSALLKPGTEFYLGAEKAIISIVSDMPSDISLAYRILLENVKETPVLPVPPSGKNVNQMKRRKKRSKKGLK